MTTEPEVAEDEREVAGWGTRFPEIFAALAAPFAENETKSRKIGGNRMASYITARTAMNRFDDVLGPENWSDDYYEVVGVLFCRITVTLPDGTRVSKCDAGGFKEMTEGGKLDKENTDKTGASDAFKRAAARFGVARYLYNDGGVEFMNVKRPPARNGSGHGQGSYASPEDTRAYEDRLKGWLDKKNMQWSDSWPVESLQYLTTTDTRELMNSWQANGHLIKWAVETGRLDAAIIPEDCKAAQKAKYIAVVYHRSKADQKALGQEMERYAAEQAERRREALYARHPEIRPDGWGESADDVLDGMADDAFEADRE